MKSNPFKNDIIVCDVSYVQKQGIWQGSQRGGNLSRILGPDGERWTFDNELRANKAKQLLSHERHYHCLYHVLQYADHADLENCTCKPAKKANKCTIICNADAINVICVFFHRGALQASRLRIAVNWFLFLNFIKSHSCTLVGFRSCWSLPCLQ